MWVYLPFVAKNFKTTFIAASSIPVVIAYPIYGAVYDRTPSCTDDEYYMREIELLTSHSS